MKKKDIVLIVILLLIFVAAVPVFAPFGGGKAYIYSNGALYGVYDLSTPARFRIEGANGIINDIEIEGNSIYVKDATCNGRQCVKCGRISRNNESILCAPAGLFIIIRSEDDAGYDAITK